MERSWQRVALRLVVATMVYNLAEGAIALWAGVSARSVALVGFGFDSYLELFAAGALLWRLRVQARGGDERTVERTDRRVHRWIGATFLALALYVSLQAIWVLWSRQPAEESRVGLALAVLSLVVMPLVAWGKLRAADALGSAALRAEAKETLACSYLSFTLLLGLAANALFGWWWADPAAALLMVPWLVKEGLEGWRGDECGC